MVVDHRLDKDEGDASPWLHRRRRRSSSEEMHRSKCLRHGFSLDQFY